MSSGSLRPEEWVNLVQRIQAGDLSVGADIAHRERNFDSIFQSISRADFVPVVSQSATLSYTDYSFNGYRVGPWVQLNFRCVVTSAGTAGNAFAITTPPQFPIDLTGLAPVVGTIWFYDSSTSTAYLGQAVAGNTTTVNGFTSGATNFMGVGGPAVTAASNDQFGYNLQFLTSAVL